MQTILSEFIPKSKILGVCFGVLISWLTTILCSLPFYFLERKVVIVYFIIVYFFVPVTTGVITTLMLGYHKQSSLIASIFYSQIALIISFIAWSLTLRPNLGYVGFFLMMYFPILMLFTAIGTMIGCEWLLRNGKLNID